MDSSHPETQSVQTCWADDRLRRASQIIVRRRQADSVATAKETVLSVVDRKTAARDLKHLFESMQRDRGRGVWSEADPEVLVDGVAVGRLRRHETVDVLVEHVLDRIRT